VLCMGARVCCRACQSRTAKGEAEDFLCSKMQPGQTYAASNIQKDAQAAGINYLTLSRAGDALRGPKGSRPRTGKAATHHQRPS
jgi:hypothetical protein